jgi:hypothetical protein
LVALSVVGANSAFAVAVFFYFHVRPPSPSLPPWKDQEILNLGLLFLLASIGMTIGLIAAAPGAPN